MKITFIGLGIMGSRMAKRLVEAGMEVTLFNRSAKKLDPFHELAVKTSSNIQEAVSDADVVITMVSTQEVLWELAFWNDAFVKSMKQGAVWLNTTTIDPENAKKFASSSEEFNISYVDAPLAGTKQPAENGELVFFVGGDQQVISFMEPIFDVLGKKTLTLGEPGEGSKMKLLINLMLAQSMVAFSETMSFGKSMGLSEGLIFNVLLNTPVVAPFLQVIRQKLENKETSPNFPLKWMLKDLNLVSETANGSWDQMKTSSAIHELFSAANNAGLGDQDFSSIFHHVNASTPTN